MRAASTLQPCGFVVLLALSACMAPSPPVRHPATMPPADGRSVTLTPSVTAFPNQYVVNRQTMPSRTGIVMRVTRLNGRDLDYSQGRDAKTAVEFYCAGFNRSLDPQARGRFSVPNSWVFDGDCL